jgi:hypothetical protein
MTVTSQNKYHYVDSGTTSASGVPVRVHFYTCIAPARSLQVRGLEKTPAGYRRNVIGSGPSPSDGLQMLAKSNLWAFRDGRPLTRPAQPTLISRLYAALFGSGE